MAPLVAAEGPGRRFRKDSPHAEKPSVRRGQAREEILSEEREGNYGLIVIGGHLARTRPASADRDLAADLMVASACPVLVVRGGL